MFNIQSSPSVLLYDSFEAYHLAVGTPLGNSEHKVGKDQEVTKDRGVREKTSFFNSHLAFPALPPQN